MIPTQILNCPCTKQDPTIAEVDNLPDVGEILTVGTVSNLFEIGVRPVPATLHFPAQEDRDPYYVHIHIHGYSIESTSPGAWKLEYRRKRHTTIIPIVPSHMFSTAILYEDPSMQENSGVFVTFGYSQRSKDIEEK